MSAHLSAMIDESGELHLHLDEAGRDQLVGRLQRLTGKSSELHVELGPQPAAVATHLGTATTDPPVITSATFRLQDSFAQLYLPHLLEIPPQE